MDPLRLPPAAAPAADRALHAPKAPVGASEAALRRAAQEFEAQVLGLLLQPIFATVNPSHGPFGGGAAEAQWRPMLVEAYAGAAARAGSGLGLADAVFREMLRAQSAQTDTNQGSPSA